MKHLDGKATWSGEVEGPGPVHVLGLTELHSRRLQPIVAVIHSPATMVAEWQAAG
jgi:hypothetical protein